MSDLDRFGLARRSAHAGWDSASHMLNHSLVADGHRAEYGVVSEAGFMGCIEADGALRAGHGVISAF